MVILSRFEFQTNGSIFKHTPQKNQPREKIVRANLSTKQNKSRRQTPKLPPGRRKVFLIITLAFPFLFFLALEFGLRIAHYGPDLSLLSTEEIAGKTYHVMNHDVKNRYFTHVEFSPNTSPDYFLIPKPPGTYRIFCLGGSTTAGYPYSYTGSFSSYLRDRLKALFPDRQIEVINFGMTATNSFTVNDIAAEVMELEPDLIIVYDGHNEFYGALGIASKESSFGGRWLTKIYLRSIHFKTFQLVKDLVGTVSGVCSSSPEKTRGTMMERLARDREVGYRSDIYNRCLENFHDNLDGLGELCRKHQVPLILSSQVSSLRDQPPFISHEQGESRPPAASRKLNQAILLMNGGNIDSASALLVRVINDDSQRADAHFYLGKCYEKMQMSHDALNEYINARDFDRLRFRTSTDFNRVIREHCDGRTVIYADIEEAFKLHSPDSLVGKNLVLDHLHPNSTGYLLMGKVYAQLMKEHNLLASTGEWNRRDTIPEKWFVDASHLTELDERCAERRTTILTSGWPFVEKEIPVPAVATRDTIGRIVERIVKGRITWEQGHVAAAEYYAKNGQLQKVEREYRALVNQVPFNVSAYLLLGQLYSRGSKYDQASEILELSLHVEPTAIAYRMLGSIDLERGKTTIALERFKRALEHSEAGKERTENGYLLAVAYARNGNREEAVGQLRSVLQAAPEYKPAKGLLQELTQTP